MTTTTVATTTTTPQRLSRRRRSAPDEEEDGAPPSAALPPSEMRGAGPMMTLSRLVAAAALTVLVVTGATRRGASAVIPPPIRGSLLHDHGPAAGGEGRAEGAAVVTTSLRGIRAVALTAGGALHDNTDGGAKQQTKKNLSPIRWRTFGHEDLRAFFQCDARDVDTDRTASRKHEHGHAEEQWEGLRQYYTSFAEENKKLGRTYPLPSIHGTKIAKEEGESKDETRHRHSRHLPVAFSNGRLFRKFVWGVHHEHDDDGLLPCALLSNARVVRLDSGGSKDPEGKAVVVVDLDEQAWVRAGSDGKEAATPASSESWKLVGL